MSRGTLTTLLLALSIATPLLAHDWPQWRGPNRDDVSKETGLLQSWPDGGPQRVWLSDEAGLGYAGFAVVDGRLYTMGGIDGMERLLAMNASTGKLLWTAEIGPLFTEQRGDGPRSSPAVDDGHVYALGSEGDLICARIDDGKVAWRTKMSLFGGSKPRWGYSESVLVDGDRVLCTPGGNQGAVVALNKKTGALLWQSNDFTDSAHYSSIVAAEVHGQRQYIQLTKDSVVGLSRDSGEVLWEADWPGRTAVVPTPIVHDGYVYVTSGYGVGCKLLKIDPGNRVSEVYANQEMVNHHGGVILLDGHVYGYSDNGGWTCQDFTTGEAKWQARRELGKGAIAYADGRFYCVDQGSGTVALIEASTQDWKEHGRFRLDPQSKQRKPSGRVWTHPVISNGKLYLRDQEYIYCYDVTRKVN